MENEIEGTECSFSDGRIGDPVHAKRAAARPPCVFCEAPAIAGEGTYPACMTHLLPAALHAARLHTGGLSDGPESRAETLRYWQARDQEARDALALLGGLRTVSDRTYQKARTSIEGLRAPQEPIPLAGQTPHYEWP